jgi:hypothetical protein
MNTKPTPSLIRAAHRAVNDPFFLASILKEYQRAHHLDNEGLATLLGCRVDDLPRLALCRRPATEQQAFVHDIDHLAQRFHLQADQLATIIRQVDILNIWQQQMPFHLQATSPNMLSAARDRDEKSSKTTEENDD